MFRKARIEMKAGKEASSKRPLPELRTLETVKAIPVVELLWSKASGGYETVKNSNMILNWYLSTTEATMNTMARISLPLVERPLKAVDGLTSKGLDMFVKSVPTVNTPPGEIVSNTKAYMHNKLQYVTETARTAKDYSTEKVAAVGKFGLSTTNSLLNNGIGRILLGTVDKMTNVVQGSVDKILPKPVKEPENPEYLSEDNNQLAKSLNKIFHIFYSAQNRLKRKRSTVAMIKSFIDDVKNICNGFDSGIDQLRQKENEDEEDILEVRDLARNVWNLTKAADAVAAGLSPELIENLRTCQMDSYSIRNSLNETSKVKDLSDETVQDFKTKVSIIREYMLKVFEAAQSEWPKLEEATLAAAAEVYVE